MANEFQNKIIAALVFIFGLALFYLLTFLVKFPDTMGGLFSDNLLRAVFWIGYILFMVSILLIKPWILISQSEKDANLKGIYQAVLL